MGQEVVLFEPFVSLSLSLLNQIIKLFKRRISLDSISSNFPGTQPAPSKAACKLAGAGAALAVGILLTVVYMTDQVDDSAFPQPLQLFCDVISAVVCSGFLYDTFSHCDRYHSLLGLQEHVNAQRATCLNCG